MKKIFCLFFLSPLFILAAESEELISVEERVVPSIKGDSFALDQLIEQDEKLLIRQKNLSEKMRLFQRQKETFVAGDQTKMHAFEMVSTARELLGMIKEEHLAYIFSSEYLDELMFFSSIGGKTAPVRP